MIKAIIGGVATVVIGGTTFAVSNTDVVNNFTKNSGMSDEQAQQYIDNISQDDLESFSKVGQALVSDGNSVQGVVAGIDCYNYNYEWETSALSCLDGKSQLQTIANDEVTLGNCYQTLDTDLGAAASAKIQECITDIDTVDADYGLPIATAILDSTTLSDQKNTNAYNKSVLQSATHNN